MSRITSHENIILIGTDEQVDEDKWGISKEINLGVPNKRGVIISFTLIATKGAAGAILRHALEIVCFGSDPVITENKDNLSAANAQVSQGAIEVQAGNWVAASSGTDGAGVAHVTPLAPLVTDSQGRIWMSVINRDAVSYNDGGTDDEQLEISFYVEWEDWA